jgi:hypothetical protein
MAPVYSVLLARAAALSGGPATVYTTPVGIRTVIRNITGVVGSNAGSVDWQLAVVGGPKIAWVQYTGVTGIDTRVFEGHWMLNPGDQLEWATGGGLVFDLYVSGYELTLP